MWDYIISCIMMPLKSFLYRQAWRGLFVPRRPNFTIYTIRKSSLKYQNYNKSRTLFRLASSRFPRIHIIKLHCKALNIRLNRIKEEHDLENNLGSTFALEESTFYPNDWLAYYLESRNPSLNKNVHLVGTNEVWMPCAIDKL